MYYHYELMMPYEAVTIKPLVKVPVPSGVVTDISLVPRVASPAI